MKFFLGFILLLCIAFGSIWLIPDTTSASKTTTFDAGIEEVWAVYTDFASQPDWREELTAIEFGPEKNSWTETIEPGAIRINIRVLELDAPNKLILKTGSLNSFEGIYTAEFETMENGTRGTFTETSTTLSYLAKLSRFVFVDQEEIIESYTRNAKNEIAKRK